MGFLRGHLPDWDRWHGSGAPVMYQLARGPNPDAARPVTCRTIYDGLHRAVAVEIEDDAILSGWAEFRYLDE